MANDTMYCCYTELSLTECHGLSTTLWLINCICCNSICAGLVAAIMGTPADVVKTRVMNQPTDSQGK